MVVVVIKVVTILVAVQRVPLEGKEHVCYIPFCTLLVIVQICEETSLLMYDNVTLYLCEATEVYTCSGYSAVSSNFTVVMQGFWL